VDELLGRGRYARRAAVDAPIGYRNGFGHPRRLSLSSGTITLRRPRVRGLDERLESRLLPAFKRRTEEVGRLLPDLYLHWPRATSIWRCGACWATGRRCRHRRSPG
jgi:hypothetical protein